MNRFPNQLIIAIFMACVVAPAFAATVHKWVDANGITHYSDEAPTTPETEVTTIEVLDPNLTKIDASDHYYSIANQWQRIQRESQEQERLRVEAARQKAAQQPAATEFVYINEPTEKRYVSTYPRSYYRKHGRHRFHKKPRHFTRHAYRKHLRGNYPIGLHPSRNRVVGSYKQVF